MNSPSGAKGMIMLTEKCVKCGAEITGDGFLADESKPYGDLICWKCKLPLAFAGEFMQPQIVEGDSWDTDNGYYDCEIFTQEDAAEDSGMPLDEVTKVHGFCARLSANGYLDATEWQGSYDTPAEALQALIDTYGDD